MSAEYTLDELVLRLRCTDGILYATREPLMIVSHTLNDLQADVPGYLNDVDVPFDRKTMRILIRAINPMLIPEEVSERQKDKVLIALDWLGPIEETDAETIVREHLGIVDERY